MNLSLFCGFLFLVSCSLVAGSTWHKIGTDICFEAKGDKPGWIPYTFIAGYNGIAEMKLVHKSGTVQCADDPNLATFWGCAFPPFADFPFNVFITDARKHVLFPKSYLSFYKRHEGWYYWLNGFTPYSKEIIFIDHGSPVKFAPGKNPLGIWYGEDLLDWHETNNSGRVCVDVYVVYADY